MQSRLLLRAIVAIFLACGFGMAATVARAAGGLVTLAQNGVSGAEANRRGDEAYERKDYAEAMRWYRLSAAQGYALGTANVGFLYSKGLGVPQNDAEAVRWYRRAAEGGQREAQYNLGLHYESGLGLAKDMAQARYWIGKAAAAGDPLAQKWLAEH
jgi:uncharacterized protein